MSHFSEKHEAEGLAMHTPEFERQIAETMAGRERFPSQTDVLVAVRAERRERIASEMYAAMVLGNFVAYAVSNGSMSLDPDPEDALERADGLMAALDAAEARDREATK